MRHRIEECMTKLAGAYEKSIEGVVPGGYFSNIDQALSLKDRTYRSVVTICFNYEVRTGKKTRKKKQYFISPFCPFCGKRIQ